MSNEIVKKLNATLSIKSLSDLVRVKTSESVLLLIDTSSSMNDRLRNGRSRMDMLGEVVTDLRKGAEVKMIAFGGMEDAAWELSTVPARGQGGTPMHAGINLARTKNAGRAIVVSDGVPNDRSLAMESAKEFGGRIDVIFVGNPGEEGEAFLKMLAESTGGTEFTGDLSKPKEIGAAIKGLLAGHDDDEEDEDEAIQL